jgi:hypothetical protein
MEEGWNKWMKRIKRELKILGTRNIWENGRNKDKNILMIMKMY